MSKILVVQPHRMLQQAIVLSLFPEHEVQVTEAVPEFLAAKDFDAVIVDAASLQETTGLASQTMRAVQNWQVPMIWIEGSDPSQTPKREKLVLMKRPIAREALQSSLAECLGTSRGSKRNGMLSAQAQEPRGSSKGAADEKKDLVSSAAQDTEFIELVDVVEEGPGRKTRKKQQN
ncbi:MAG TPA: hypothetical protein VMO00_09405 [Methylomirabilota bacterium]|nr:hypothetical protein [Methylomirabilota bacterium]